MNLTFRMLVNIYFQKYILSSSPQDEAKAHQINEPIKPLLPVLYEARYRGVIMWYNAFDNAKFIELDIILNANSF